jgi:Flp pilus assembly protein TadG
MSVKSHFTRLRQRLGRFRSARGGNVAITFAIATVPIFGAVAAAVDYSHANSIKAAMQAALDSTALMLAKQAATMTDGQLQASASNYFKAMFTRPEAKSVAVTAQLDSSSGYALTLNGSAVMKTDFLGIMGIPQLNITATSTTAWGNVRLRVALALDVTGSMASDGKMNALKIATKNLLDQLKAAAIKNGDVYVSIIPFSKDVNAGPTNYNQNWVRWDLWDEENGTCSKSGSNTRTACVATGTCSNSSKKTKNSCTSSGGTWTAATWTPKNHNTWNGCVTDRDQDYDTKNTAPEVGNEPTLFPAEQYSQCPVPVMGLTYDWVALKAKVDALEPVGNTNQGIGAQWAFQSLTSAPFTVPAFDSQYKYQQIIILLTDGLNTQNRWYSNASQIDARQKLTCANAKTAGITIYAVQVNTGGDPTQDVLRQCASSSDKFFLLTSAGQIVTTFQSIATQLSQLRVAK